MNLKRAGLIVATFVVMSFNSGCGVSGLPLDPRLTDGGGGDLLSAGYKTVNGQLTHLTQDEVQQLGDKVNEVVHLANPNVNLPPLSNAQADAFLAFLRANNAPGDNTKGLSSVDELRRFAEAALTDPSMVVFPEGFLEAFSDQLNVLDVGDVNLEDVFGSVFCGL